MLGRPWMTASVSSSRKTVADGRVRGQTWWSRLRWSGAVWLVAVLLCCTARQAPRGLRIVDQGPVARRLPAVLTGQQHPSLTVANRRDADRLLQRACSGTAGRSDLFRVGSREAVEWGSIPGPAAWSRSARFAPRSCRRHRWSSVIAAAGTIAGPRIRITWREVCLPERAIVTNVGLDVSRV
jgi:hypothetical protein